MPERAMDKLVESVTSSLTRSKNTIAVAESCTGGMLSSLLTSASGSSSYFIGGIVSYHPSIKERELNISSQLLRDTNAVSEEMARQMAEAIRKRYQTDFGIGITGIAGPAGGTIDKPVGLVHAAISAKNELVSATFRFHGERNRIRRQACVETLRLLMSKLA